MAKILVDYPQAKGEIQRLQSQIDSALAKNKAQIAKLSSILNESQGEFVNALKEQIQAEEQIIAASEGFFQQLCQALGKAVDTYEEQDKKIEQSMNKAIS